MGSGVGPSLVPGVAPWITVNDVVANAPGISESVDHYDLIDDYAAVASSLMYELSGRQFPGQQTRKVRPCRSGCGCWGAESTGFTYWSWTYSNLGGWSWVNEGGDTCGCGHESYIELSGPVVSISEVKVDGVVIPPTDYRLDLRHKLIYMQDVSSPDNPQPRQWPVCQDLDLGDDQAGTFSVTYVWGADPPMLGKLAAAQLALELWKSGPGAGESKLPARVTKITRGGVTMDKIVPISDLMMKGNTGLVYVDLFIAGYNHTKMRRRPVVWSPDRQNPARKVGS